MTNPRRWVLLVTALGGLNCSSSNEQKAAAGAAAMVIMTGANRALTGECWAACTPGYVCNHESGLCEPGECSPQCLDDQLCAKVQQQLICVDKGTVYKANLKGRGPMIPAGGPPTSSPTSSGLVSQPEPISVATAPATCPRPGSDAWYSQANATNSNANPSEGSTSAEPEHDFVGVWRIASEAGTKQARAPRPLIVTDSWYGYKEDTAQSYEVLSKRSSQLVILSSPRTAATSHNVVVDFVGRDSIRLQHGRYIRQDCRAEAYDPACCALPRAHWVRLGPDS